MRPVRAYEAIVVSAECAMGRWTTRPPGYVSVLTRQFAGGGKSLFGPHQREVEADQQRGEADHEGGQNDWDPRVFVQGQVGVRLQPGEAELVAVGGDHAVPDPERTAPAEVHVAGIQREDVLGLCQMQVAPIQPDQQDRVLELRRAWRDRLVHDLRIRDEDRCRTQLLRGWAGGGDLDHAVRELWVADEDGRPVFEHPTV